MANIPRQDRTRARTPEDLEKKYNFEERAKKLESVGKAVHYQDQELSIQKSITELYGDIISAIIIDISNKVDKVEGKVLSSNDFTNAYKKKIDDLVLKNEEKEYNLNQYKTENVTNLNGRCVVKNKRAVINVVITAEITAEVSTNLFINLPFTENIKIRLNNGVCTFNNGTCSVLLNEDVNNLILNLVFDLN